MRAPPAAPTTTTPVTTLTPSAAIASAPALRNSLMSSSTPAPSIGPLIEIITPGPATGSSPAYALTRCEVGRDLVDRHVATGAVLDERGELTLEASNPRAEAGRSAH